MNTKTTLMERWREQVISRFGKALLDECDKHGGIAAYCALIKIQQPAFGTWVRNQIRPGRKHAERLVAVSPALKPHLEERGCFDGRSVPGSAFRSKRAAAVPMNAPAQTTEVATRKHERSLTEAEQRALKHKRRVLIRKRAQRQRDRDKRTFAIRTISHAHYNPCTHGGHLAVVEDIGNSAADVGVPTTYGVEES